MAVCPNFSNLGHWHRLTPFLCTMDFSEQTALYQHYLSKRDKTLEKKHFDTLFMFFPSLLVIASDGEVDEEEWVYVRYLAKFMADTFRDEHTQEERDQLQDVFLAELTFLLETLSSWEKRFIPVMEHYLGIHPEAKEDVLDILHLFAEASDGESDAEAEKISQLSHQLGLDQ